MALAIGFAVWCALAVVAAAGFSLMRHMQKKHAAHTQIADIERTRP